MYVLSFYAVWNKKYTDTIINVQQELVELNREIASENNKRKVKQGKGGRKVKKSRKSNAADIDNTSTSSSKKGGLSSKLTQDKDRNSFI